MYCAPVAGIKNNYGAEMTEEEYNKATVEGCLEAGTLAFTGDGIDIDTLFAKPLQAVLDHDGMGIPTIKPWCEEGVQARIERFKGHKVFALATDVDAAGLVLRAKERRPVVNKSVADLKKMKEMARRHPADRQRCFNGGRGAEVRRSRSRCDCCQQSWRTRSG